MKSRTTITKSLAGIAPALLLCFFAGQVSAASIKHLKAPDDAADCYECHKKVTPRVVQNWYESKHGVALMKCFVCHGQPDGKGSIPFMVVPEPKAVCRKCHEPAMIRMEKKFDIEPDCYNCHIFHQNSLHHGAYKKSESKN
jgi:hypothetical protein